MMITVAPELKASLRVARAVLASRAGPWGGRSALAVALLVSVAPGVIARQQAATSQASEEVTLISTGWAYLAAGDLARAVDHANLALAKSPRSLAAITLLVHADIMRAGALTGLDRTSSGLEDGHRTMATCFDTSPGRRFSRFGVRQICLRASRP